MHLGPHRRVLGAQEAGLPGNPRPQFVRYLRRSRLRRFASAQRRPDRLARRAKDEPVQPDVFIELHFGARAIGPTQDEALAIGLRNGARILNAMELRAANLRGQRLPGVGVGPGPIHGAQRHQLLEPAVVDYDAIAGINRLHQDRFALGWMIRGHLLGEPAVGPHRLLRLEATSSRKHALAFIGEQQNQTAVHLLPKLRMPAGQRRQLAQVEELGKSATNHLPRLVQH